MTKALPSQEVRERLITELSESARATVNRVWIENELDRPNPWDTGRVPGEDAPAPPPGPKPIILGEKKKWIPFAESTPVDLPTSGKYADGGPLGMVVHFPAGRWEKGDETAKNIIRGLGKDGWAALVLSRTGKLFQDHPNDEWGDHAGVSAIPGLGSGMNSKLVGLEVVSAGRLTKIGDKFYPWYAFDKPMKVLLHPEYAIPSDQVRHIEKARYSGESPGYYHLYTEAQEREIIRIALWYKVQFPKFQLAYVVGHDELRLWAGKPGDKNDPGGALSMSMDDLRRKLVTIWTAPDRDDQLRALGVA